jgi:hypothetical protein
MPHDVLDREHPGDGVDSEGNWFVCSQGIWGKPRWALDRSCWPLLSDEDTSLGAVLIGFTSVIRFGFMAAFLTGPYPVPQPAILTRAKGFQDDFPGETCWTSHAFHAGLSFQMMIVPGGVMVQYGQALSFR